MKLFISFLIINFFIIDGIQNVPVIHPIHVQTALLRPIPLRFTSGYVTTRKPITSPVISIRPTKHSWWHQRSSTQLTNLIPSLAPFTIHYYSSWWYRTSPAVRIILYILLGGGLISLTCKVLDYCCTSSKQRKPSKNNEPLVTENKMYVSTINGQREEAPPSYVETHNV
ncbi:unnamed protein product [Rotaria sp. Silwood1]|nr:unnamed protein product [Rotaria sp. Silwood1]CAF1033561.1 unnamed protein product [Rotaria sp. Silwood1]CAF1041227.1 unnamed protein product [Rotaria sp. Silwood1]CAF3391412.1 unnamed protein product [Rotaria sp. Silwood1]CAF3425201.1 unnamed protein product [Rotaria sp. Silwood1]